MGASSSVAVALFFIGFFVIGTSAYSMVDYYNNLVKNAQHVQDTLKKAKMQTDIAITNVTNMTTYLNLTIMNTGKTTLNASLLEIFVNGNYYPSYSLTPASNYTWVPKNSTNITINVAATTGNRIKVVAENGISAYALSP